MEEKRIAQVSESQQIVDGVVNAQSEIFCSFQVTDNKDRMKLYNATSAEGETVKSCINKIIKMVDAVIMPVEVKNEDGTTALVPRVTMIDEKGKFYSATSWGVYNSLKKISAIFGGLHFEEAISISPVEVKTKNGFTINLKLV